MRARRVGPRSASDVLGSARGPQLAVIFKDFIKSLPTS